MITCSSLLRLVFHCTHTSYLAEVLEIRNPLNFKEKNIEKFERREYSVMNILLNSAQRLYAHFS